MTTTRVTVSSRLPDFPWDALAPYAERARAHPDGIVDLSVGTPVDPTPEVVQRALAAAADSPGYPTTIGTPEVRQAAMFGENLTLVGATEDGIYIGDRFRWGDAVLEVSQPRGPCYKFAIHTARADAPQLMTVSSRCGWYLRVVEEGQGKITKQEYWGLKNLAFKIKKNRKAHYAFFNIDSPPAAVAEMERRMGINTDIMRFMTVRVDELDPEPSAMMQKRDRDDRKDRERGRRRDDEGFGGGFGGDRGDRGDRGERSFGGEG